MSLSTSFSRLVEYQRRHGFRATLRRAGVAAKRAVFAGDMVVFYCDLDESKFRPVKVPAGFSIVRLESLSALSDEDFQQVTAFWNPKLASANIRERFENGAVLWLVKSGESVAAYGWTLRGRSIEPYYFPLAEDDVHFFDFHVFPEFRGRGMNPFLVQWILNDLAKSGLRRAFIEAAEWNHNQLRSLSKTPFRCLGRVKAFRLLRHIFGSRRSNNPAGRTQQISRAGDQLWKAAGSK